MDIGRSSIVNVMFDINMMTDMDTNRKHRHNAEVRDRILTAAAAAFRRAGYAATGIDAVMAEAGLTRGAFYAHFASKEALFAEVVQHRHPLLDRLRARRGETGEALHSQLLEQFDAYLDPANFTAVARGCTAAALAGDVAHAGAAAQAGFTAAHAAILAEMARGQGGRPRPWSAALTLAVGAVQMAAACNGPDRRAAILTEARAAVHALLGAAPSPLADRAGIG
ncbi:TetR/AcrR family transcriptional regulator [Rhodobacteraceae bacterium CCMM004]|nr:TetR/AcrR family transcriptional regulator [Rhodobacteraceae bacterium CCMM004]